MAETARRQSGSVVRLLVLLNAVLVSMWHVPASVAVSPTATLESAQVLESRETAADAQGRYRRIRVVKTTLRYPHIRIEERLRRDPATGVVTVAGRTEMVADHILVKLRPGKTKADLNTLCSRLGGRITEVVHKPDSYVVTLVGNGADAVPIATAAYSAERDVIAYAEPDHLIYPCGTVPSDTRFGEQWGMRNLGQETPPGSGIFGSLGADIHAPDAWMIARGNRDVVVGVLDTGIDFTHPDLENNIWINQAELKYNGAYIYPGLANYDANADGRIDAAELLAFMRANNYDFDGNGVVDLRDVISPNSSNLFMARPVDPGDDYPHDILGWDFTHDPNMPNDLGDNDSSDYQLHGTHVAGIIGAAGNNVRGVAGVCWRVRILSAKIFPNPYQPAFQSWTVKAIDYATAMGVSLTNNSWGGGPFSQPTYDAVSRASAAGILFVAAAGNYSNSPDLNNDEFPFYPASYSLDNIITVAATDSSDDLAWFSHYGQASVDLGAPGVGVLSTFPTYRTDEMDSWGFSSNYEYLDGTSMACPHVAGACALLKSVRPTWSHTRIRDVVLQTVDKIPALQEIPGERDRMVASEGRLNAYNMLLKCSRQGLIALDRDVYPLGSSVTITLTDCDLNENSQTAETRSVTITSTTEPAGKSVTLTETGPDTGAFRGTIALSTTGGPGVLHVSDADTLSVTYHDADDGTQSPTVHPADIAATATVDLSAPTITGGPTALLIRQRTAVIRVNMSEPARVTIRYGTTCAALNSTAKGEGLAVWQSVTLGGLAPNVQYFYTVALEDEAGNTATYDNAGQCYSFTTRPYTNPTYVNEHATGSNDGTSWANAMTDLQAAMAAAEESGGVVTQIWVAAGTYKPSKRTGAANESLPFGRRLATFNLPAGVALYGGFAGGEASLDQRAPASNQTILSGNIGNPTDDSDNAYHVVRVQDIDASLRPILDGFTITAGKASGSYSWHDKGAGLLVLYASVKVANCVFIGNAATTGGAAICFEGISTGILDVSDCVFAASTGGAVSTAGGNQTITRCVFSGGTGAALTTGGDAVTVSNCVIAGHDSHEAGLDGPTILNSGTTMRDCLIVGNVAQQRGAAISCGGGTTIRNCTMANNSTSSSVFTRGALYAYDSGVNVSNCILWGNGDYEIPAGQAQFFTVTYSDVEGGWTGTGNISTDPLFVEVPLGTGTWTASSSYDATTGKTTFTDTGITCTNNALVGKLLRPSESASPALEYIIAANTGHTIVVWGHASAGVGDSYRVHDYHLGFGSYCIDKGDPNLTPPQGETDIDGDLRWQYQRVDIGADEYLRCGAPDFDGDCDVDLADFGAFQTCFNGPNRPRRPLTDGCTVAATDLDGDGDVDMMDFLSFQTCFNGPNRPPACPSWTAPVCNTPPPSAPMLAANGPGSSSFEMLTESGSSCSAGIDVTFALRSPQAGQTVTAGTPIEWYASVCVSGTNQGLGGFSYDLFLGPNTGPQPGADGIWGTPDDANLVSMTLDQAYLSEAYAVAGANGKPTTGAGVTSPGSGGGPGLNVAQSVGHNEQPGTLLQMGAGYMDWNPWRYKPPPRPAWLGEHTWGVGMASRKDTLLLDTGGEYDLHMGWIDTTNLAAGHYVLVLVPADRVTVLRSDVDLSIGQLGGIVQPAGSVSGPVSIEFDIGQ